MLLLLQLSLAEESCGENYTCVAYPYGCAPISNASDMVCCSAGQRGEPGVNAFCSDQDKSKLPFCPVTTPESGATGDGCVRADVASGTAKVFDAFQPKTCGTSCSVLGCDFYERGCPCQCNKCVEHDDCCADWDAACDGGHNTTHGPDGGPEQHHLSLGATPAEMVVSFATAKGRFAGLVPSCTLMLPGGYNTTFEGTTHTYVDGGWLGLLHTVRLTGLAPATRHVYQCFVGETAGEPHSFLSAPPVGHFPVSIGVVGDMGEGCNKTFSSGQDECSNRTIARLAADVATNAEHAAASAADVAKKSEHGAASATAPFTMLLHVGDIAYIGGVETVYDGFFNELEPIASAVPYQVCVGNHEHYNNFTGYLSRFTMSAGAVGEHASGSGPTTRSSINNLFYSFDFGGVHFVAYSTEQTSRPSSSSLRPTSPRSIAPSRRGLSRSPTSPSTARRTTTTIATSAAQASEPCSSHSSRRTVSTSPCSAICTTTSARGPCTMAQWPPGRTRTLPLPCTRSSAWRVISKDYRTSSWTPLRHGRRTATRGSATRGSTL